MNNQIIKSKNIVSELKNILKIAVGKLGLEVKLSDIHLEHPAIEKHGDYSANLALSFLAKSEYKNPREFAEAIVAQILLDKINFLENISIAGPGFINFRLANNFLLDQVQLIKQQKDGYGTTEINKGKTWLLEHTSPNPNKSMHLGHLRNNVTGMAIGNIWQATGVNVVRDCIDNDRGIAIAKLMWGYLKFARKDNKTITDIDYWRDHQSQWQTPQDLGIRPDLFVDQLYVKGSKDFKNPEVEKIVRNMVVAWENKDEKIWQLWKRVLNYSHQGQKLTLDRLGNKWDKVWHEHEHYQQGKDLVELGLKENIFRKLENGAILTNLEKDFNLTDTVVQKSDGTSLYITQDLALTRMKKNKFHPDKMFWVIGPEQSLAMKQAFAVCDQLGIINYNKCHHLAYGYMTIKGEGKMSSREGNVVYIDDLIDKVRDQIITLIKVNFKSQQEKIKLAEEIAVGAIKYSILKNGRLINTAFDINESISLSGNSGPYLQYTYARCKSVIAKYSSSDEQINNDHLKNLEFNLEELSVMRFLYRFPEVIQLSANEYAPNYICTYLYDLAQKYNTFYNKHSVLNAESEAQKIFRINLTQAVSQVIKNGLKLLGISSPEKM